VVDAACRRLVTLRNRGFPALAEAVAELQPRQVYINEYPVALFERMDPAGHPIDGGGCEIFSGADLDLSVDDWRAIKAIGVELNAAIHEAAAIHRWILIDGIVESFSGHGYCATADPRRPGAATNVRGSYFRTATQSCLNQGDFEGTMHPNEHGHQVYAERIAATVTANVARRDRWLVPALQAMMSPPTVVLWI
jgi:hypothetical protein